MKNTYVPECIIDIHEWITRFISCYPRRQYIKGTGSSLVDKSSQFHKHFAPFLLVKHKSRTSRKESLFETNEEIRIM
jgi:hypothetical protein